MKAIRNWHKYLGLVTTVLVMLVSITGILLIHKKELGLNKITVPVPGYGKKVPPDASDIVSIGNRTILATKMGVFTGDVEGWRKTLTIPAKKLYADRSAVYACTPAGLQQSSDGGDSWHNVLPGEDVRAMYFGAGKAVVATTKGLFLEQDGKKGWELLARLPGKGIDVREIVPRGDDVYLLAAKEGLYSVDTGKVQPVKLPAGEHNAPVELQKIITDLHTGAFFGNWFIFIIDLVAVSLLFFAISGVWLWYVPWKKKRQT